MKLNLKIILFSLFIVFTLLNPCKLQAQFSAAFYQNNVSSKIAIGYEFNDKLWSEFRFYSGTNIEDFTPEIVLNYNFIRQDYYNTYLGLGFVLNQINGLVVPIGVGVKPFENLKNLSFNIEFTPQVLTELDGILFSGFVGVRFVFN